MFKGPGVLARWQTCRFPATINTNKRRQGLGTNKCWKFNEARDSIQLKKTSKGTVARSLAAAANGWILISSARRD